jgi:hypothetical protein
MGRPARPRLLLGWRQREGQWKGWVISAQIGPQDPGPYIRQGWVRAESIKRLGQLVNLTGQSELGTKVMAAKMMAEASKST